MEGKEQGTAINRLRRSSGTRVDLVEERMCAACGKTDKSQINVLIGDCFIEAGGKKG